MNRGLVALIATAIVLFLALILGVQLMTQEEQADVNVLETANRLYDRNNLAEAILLYEQLVARGVNESTVYYNLGNAYYRQGDLGRALLNFNRAAKLTPRDADIRANRDLVRNQISQPILEDDLGVAGTFSHITDGWLSFNEAAIVALVLWFLIIFFLTASSYIGNKGIKDRLRYLALGLLIALVVIGISLGSRFYTEQNKPLGFIVAPTIAVSSEPKDGYDTDLQLSSGAEIRLEKRQGDWAKLAVEGSQSESWVPIDALELVTESASSGSGMG